MQADRQTPRSAGTQKDQDPPNRQAGGVRLIEENGYAATTVEQIAEAAEVSASTFFRYFPTKDRVCSPTTWTR